jgi:molecular chaperone GrpE
MKSSSHNSTDSHETAEETLNTAETPQPSSAEQTAGQSLSGDTTAETVQGDASETAELNPIVALEAEIAHLRDSLLRRTAELDNAKKRAARERILIFDEAKSEALKAFLPINDDLQRSLNASAGQPIPDAFLQGITLVAEKFAHVLESSGIKPIDEANVPFNVNLHDALMRRPADDPSVPSDTVLQILETGYKLGDRVIRHAKVIVSE